MGIVRHDPFKNMDTGEVFHMGRTRTTRAQVHRMLKKNGIEHDHSAPLEDLWRIVVSKQIIPELVPPGLMPDADPLDPRNYKETAPVENKIKMGSDGWPQQVPVLKKWCKTRGILFKNTAKRVDLVAALEKHQSDMNGD